MLLDRHSPWRAKRVSKEVSANTIRDTRAERDVCLIVLVLTCLRALGVSTWAMP